MNVKVIVFSDSIAIEDKISTKDGKRFGKWILRKTFDNDIPRNIVWREKSPMQDGSGTANLTNLFNTIITDEIFNQKKNDILEEDGVHIRSKESLHYYECFRKINPVSTSKSDNRSIASASSLKGSLKTFISYFPDNFSMSTNC